jgi:hypothetical protein
MQSEVQYVIKFASLKNTAQDYGINCHEIYFNLDDLNFTKSASVMFVLLLGWRGGGFIWQLC